MKGTTSSAFVRSPDMAAARCTCGVEDVHEVSKGLGTLQRTFSRSPRARAASCMVLKNQTS